LKKAIVLIPMAGAGSRFAKAGYTFPKPLIPINNKPMIQVVVENLDIDDADYVFLVQKEHYETYKLDMVLNLIKPGCTIVQVDGLTEGAACTTLFAKEFIDNDRPLIIANSDQYIEFDKISFNYLLSDLDADGTILTFNSTHPKWSFVQLDIDGYVTRLAEKEPISDIATVGIYIWSKGSDYVRYAEQMIGKNMRVNGEFYIAPTYNEAINEGKKINTFKIDRMWGTGIPEDLDFFLKHYSKLDNL
jgi:dTDP-glucose pyrophosphorylase